MGKGAGTALPFGEVSRAPCPRVLSQLRIMTAWARRTRVFAIGETSCQRLCPPYETVHYVESKENRPLFRLWARGSPAFLSSVSLANEGVGAPTRRCLDCSRLEWFWA